MKIITSKTVQSTEARNTLRKLGFRCTALGVNEKWEKRITAVTISVTLNGESSTIDAYLGKSFVPFFSSRSYLTEHTLSYVKRVIDTFTACSTDLLRLIPIASSADSIDSPDHKAAIDGQLELAGLITKVFASSDDEESSFDFSTFDQVRAMPITGDNEFDENGRQIRKLR